MKIEINDEQAYVIVEALDLFSRVLIGQVEETGSVMNKYSVNMLDSEMVGAVGKQEEADARRNDDESAEIPAGMGKAQSPDRGIPCQMPRYPD